MQWNGWLLPCAHLGMVIEFMREQRGMTLTELADGLTTEGYAATTATCREIDAGRYLPDEGETFVRACERVLQLTDKELQTLLTQYAFEVLRRALGEDLAREALHERLSARAPD